MKNRIRQMGKITIISSIMFFSLLFIIKEFFSEVIDNNTIVSAIRILQIISFIICSICVFIGAIIQIIIDMKNYKKSIVKERIIFPIYILILYMIYQFVTRQINVGEIFLATFVALIISFAKYFYYSIQEK